MKNKIELLAPAGGLSQLETALHFGADAVYGGLTKFGLRAYANNFNYETLKTAVDLVHKNNKKFYLTMNSMPNDTAMEALLEAAKKAHEIGIDAAIVSDIGVMRLLSKNIPNLPLHISTQANVLNSEAALFFHEAFNAERIILARELNLEQIKDMRKSLPQEIELEAFVHGAMCMAYSGRCLLSNALTGRGGNQGECAQSCRWKYSLVEAKRPGEEIPIYEDENGTYLLSSYDMCMLPNLPELLDSGLSSLKIEGRMKNEYYVATVVSAYRKALDALYESEDKFNELLPFLMKELDKVGHRATNTGFYYGNPEPPAGAEGVIQSMEYVGKINTTALANEETAVTLKNRFFVGDKLEVVSPTGIYEYTPEYIKLEKDGSLVNTYSVANEIVYLKFPFNVSKGDIIRGPNRNHRFSI